MLSFDNNKIDPSQVIIAGRFPVAHGRHRDVVLGWIDFRARFILSFKRPVRILDTVDFERPKDFGGRTTDEIDVQFAMVARLGALHAGRVHQCC